jgi:hypothetical protein
MVLIYMKLMMCRNIFSRNCSILEALQFIFDNNFSEIYLNSKIVFKIILTLLVTIATAEGRLLCWELYNKLSVINHQSRKITPLSHYRLNITLPKVWNLIMYLSSFRFWCKRSRMIKVLIKYMILCNLKFIINFIILNI